MAVVAILLRTIDSPRWIAEGVRVLGKNKSAKQMQIWRKFYGGAVHVLQIPCNNDHPRPLTMNLVN